MKFKFMTNTNTNTDTKTNTYKYNSLCQIRVEVGGVAKGGDSGANTEVVRDSATGGGGGGQFVQSVHLVSAECLL